MPHHLGEIEEKWKKTWEYHLIATGQALRELYFQRFTPEFLDEYNVYMFGADAVLHTAYVQTVLTASNGEHFYLQNIGYTERPKWELSGRDCRGKWFRVEMMDTNLQQQIEEKIHA